MDEDEFKLIQMGKMSQFGGMFQLALREEMLKEFLQTQEETKDDCIRAQACGERIFINQVFIHDQLGILSEGVVNVTNIIFQETNFVLRKIVCPHTFIENEQWNVICIKEEFHPRLVTILQIIYQ